MRRRTKFSQRSLCRRSAHLVRRSHWSALVDAKWLYLFHTLANWLPRRAADCPRRDHRTTYIGSHVAERMKIWKQWLAKLLSRALKCCQCGYKQPRNALFCSYESRRLTHNAWVSGGYSIRSKYSGRISAQKVNFCQFQRLVKSSRGFTSSVEVDLKISQKI